MSLEVAEAWEVEQEKATNVPSWCPNPLKRTFDIELYYSFIATVINFDYSWHVLVYKLYILNFLAKPTQEASKNDEIV